MEYVVELLEYNLIIFHQINVDDQELEHDQFVSVLLDDVLD